MRSKIKKWKLKPMLFINKTVWVCSPFISAEQISKLKTGNTCVFPFDGDNKSHIRLLTWYWFMPLDTDLTFFLKLKHNSTLSLVFWKGLRKNYSQWVFISQNKRWVFLGESVIIQLLKHNISNFCLLSSCGPFLLAFTIFQCHICKRMRQTVGAKFTDAVLTVVGNGGVVPPWWLKPLQQVIKHKWWVHEMIDGKGEKKYNNVQLHKTTGLVYLFESWSFILNESFIVSYRDS